MNGFIYFIACEPMEAVKIGFTSKQNVRLRVKALQTGCPSPLKLLAYVQGTLDEEQRLHTAFAPLHISGEWFRNEHKLLDFIHYLPMPEGKESPRTAFESGLYDVLVGSGLWYPYGDTPEAVYASTATPKPFDHIIRLFEGDEG